MTLHVWQNAVLLYKEICRVFRPFSYELKKLINLIKSLESKKENGNWDDSLYLME